MYGHVDFSILDHKILPAMIAFRFYLSVQNLRTAVFGFTSNVYENWRSDFLALGCLTGTEKPDYIGLLSVNISVVDTMAAWRIALYYDYQHIYIYILMFSIHQCSYKALSLHDWPTPIITTRFSRSECHKHALCSMVERVSWYVVLLMWLWYLRLESRSSTSLLLYLIMHT